MADSDSGGLCFQCFLMTESETVQISVVYLTGQARCKTSIAFVKKKIIDKSFLTLKVLHTSESYSSGK